MGKNFKINTQKNIDQIKEQKLMKYLVFYDGDCGFCNYWTQIISRNDQKKEIFFAALQSDRGQFFLKERQLSQTDYDSLIFWEIGKAYYKKSTAIFRLAQIVKGPLFLLYLGSYFPKFLTDLIYDWFAKNRFRLKTTTCTLPSEEERKQFLD